MEALGVIGAFYLEEIYRLLVYVQLGDWNCSEQLISGCEFSVNFCFKALIGSLKDQNKKVDGVIFLKCGFDLYVAVKLIVIFCDLCGG
jgi:hypothetical protein